MSLRKCAWCGKRIPVKGRCPCKSGRPAGLNESRYTFCLAYLANGLNGSAAYKTAYPGCTDGTARANAAQLLANPSVKAFLEPQLAARWKAMQMDGEESAARVAAIARASIVDCLDDAGKILPPHEWPECIRLAVESYDVAGKIKLANKLTSLRTILELTGKVRSTADSIDDLAAAMRADRERHAKGTP